MCIRDREDSTTITSNSVITLFEDAKGTMWFGTNGGGLCSFDAKEKRFIEFDPVSYTHLDVYKRQGKCVYELKPYDAYVRNSCQLRVR